MSHHIDAIYFTNKLSKISCDLRHVPSIYDDELSLAFLLESAFELKVRSKICFRRVGKRIEQFQLKGSPHQGCFPVWVRDSMTFSVGVNRK